MKRTFITPCELKPDAWKLAHEFVGQLRTRGLVPSHRVGVQPRGGWWWVVLETDDDVTPDVQLTYKIADWIGKRQEKG